MVECPPAPWLSLIHEGWQMRGRPLQRWFGPRPHPARGDLLTRLGRGSGVRAVRPTHNARRGMALLRFSVLPAGHRAMGHPKSRWAHPPGTNAPLRLCGELIDGQILMTATVAGSSPETTTSNFSANHWYPLVRAPARGPAVEVSRCYSVVTKSEFAVLLSEQLQTPGFRTDLGSPSHLVSQS